MATMSCAIHATGGVGRQPVLLRESPKYLKNSCSSIHGLIGRPLRLPCIDLNSFCASPWPSRRKARRHIVRSGLLDMAPPHKLQELNLELPSYDPIMGPPLDLVVVGSGPAGLAVAQRVSASGLRVCCIDPTPRSIWPNNYGVWVDEFESLDLADCLDYTWDTAVVYLDDEREKRLDRPYGRVNRTRLKQKMMEKCVQNGVMFHKALVDGVSHNYDGSVVRCKDGTQIQATAVLDATGFSRRLVEFDETFNPGFQYAYGIVAEVESHPFEVDKMLFMDWRDSHLAQHPTVLEGNRKLPTFLYAMPFSSTRIFLEETSLVARCQVKSATGEVKFEGVPFPDIIRRMELRLEHLGIKVTSIEEDEYCRIPMGGVLPRLPQRVLGIGGTAGMVHPSTGYMIARTLSSAPILADTLVQRLGGMRSRAMPVPSPELREVVTGGGTAVATLPEVVAALPLPPVSADDVSKAVWAQLWSLERIEQREFFCFGMDVLLRLDLEGTRRFFDAFFDLSPYHWQGFLSSRLYFTELIGFGLALFSHAKNPARLEIMAKGTPGLLHMIKTLVKLRS
eukprot:TRINITY_DN23763_c0_g1_i1.p1 TRINITY_DN23763_c0_g1~~TRINITY_DN23763_c0_g1_i1.p1  ORF type:complete len:576 (+),score=78.67 TRINITY_DN23763_c0_g1_i1:39-1730(+)